METDFLASGNYYLPFSQAAVNCYQWKQSILYYFDQRKRVFCLALFRDFFCQWKLFLKSGKSQFLKIYSCQQTSISLLLSETFKVEPDFPYSGNVFFQYPPESANRFYTQQKQCFFGQSYPVFFIFCRDLLKWNYVFPIKEKYFTINRLSAQWRQILCLVETVLFDQSYFSASGNHYWNQGKTVFKVKTYFGWWTTDFPTSR